MIHKLLSAALFVSITVGQEEEAETAFIITRQPHKHGPPARPPIVQIGGESYGDEPVRKSTRQTNPYMPGKGIAKVTNADIN